MNRDIKLLSEAYLNEIFGLFKKPDPNILKYVEHLESIAGRSFGNVEAAEFYHEKVPSALWKDVLKLFKKRNPDSVVPSYIESGLGSNQHKLQPTKKKPSGSLFGIMFPPYGDVGESVGPISGNSEKEIMNNLIEDQFSISDFKFDKKIGNVKLYTSDEMFILIGPSREEIIDKAVELQDEE